MQPDWEAQFQELLKRVERLEAVTGIAHPAVTSDATPPAARERSPLPVAALGRALLGLAGAYLLRAFTESGALPHRAGIAAGLLYAMGWLIWAARTPATQRIETALHSLTSVLVLAPLLWEATLRFHAVWQEGEPGAHTPG